METIKNYLENMFSHLPNTPEVQKAKYELYQMMEDKYLEMKAEGKSENVVCYISDFRDSVGSGDRYSLYNADKCRGV